MTLSKYGLVKVGCQSLGYLKSAGRRLVGMSVRGKVSERTDTQTRSDRTFMKCEQRVRCAKQESGRGVRLHSMQRPAWESRLHLANQELKTFHGGGDLLMTQQIRRFQRDHYFRMLFRQLPGAVWTTDRNLCLTYVVGRLARNVSLRAKPGMSVFDVLGTREPTNPVIACH